MHYNFLIRGNIDAQRELIESLKWAKFKMPVFNEKGEKIREDIVCGNVEPIQLYSYVFPEEHRDLVLNALGGTKENMERWYGTGIKNQIALTALRKALRSEKIPSDIDKTKKMWIPEEVRGVLAITPIGIKKDIKMFKRPDGTYAEGI